MKKLIIILLALICTVGGFAQKAKFGHVDYGAIMKEMPGIDTAQTALLNVQKELQEAGQQMANEFKQKETEYGQMANNGASAAERRLTHGLRWVDMEKTFPVSSTETVIPSADFTSMTEA